MRRIFATYLLLLCNIVCLGYGREKVTISEKVIGKNLLTNEDIKAKEYVFSDKIYDLKIDSQSNRFTVQLRGVSKNGKTLYNSGQVVIYDALQQKVLWHRGIGYLTRELEQFGNYLVQTTIGMCCRVDPNTGQTLWNTRHTLLYADAKQRTGVGYRNTATLGTLEGIDLDHGTVKWRRDIPLQSGWDDVFKYNDSVVIIVCNGIHWLNLNNGAGWDYDIKTIEDFSGYVTATNVVSNILPDDNRLYIAGSEKLVCLNTHGKEVWSTPRFMHSYLSASKLFCSDSVLYMVNTGTAKIAKLARDGVIYNSEISHGRPFIAAYDKYTGKKLFLKDFQYRGSQINDYDLDNDHIYLLFDDRITRYALKDNQVTEKVFNVDSIGTLQDFVGGQAYLPARGGSYQSLSLSDITRQYFLTDKSKVFILDNMNIISNADVENFHLLYLTSKRHQFIAKKGETTLLDNYGRPIASLKMSKESFLNGKTLYDVQDDRIVEVNLEELLID